MPGFGFSINVSADIKAFTARLDEIQKENIPFVSAYALTKTAQDIKAELVSVMAKVFDRPTRFTLNALYVKPATKRDLQAAVLFKEGFGSIPAWRYLGPQVEGGNRSHKSFELRLIRSGVMRADEYAMGGQAAKLDQHGNLPGSEIERILSQLQSAEGFAGYLANETTKSRQRNKRRKAARYFVLRGVDGAPDGIYARGAGSRSIIPVLIFVRQPRYAKRFPYYETARRVFKDRFTKHFRDGMARFGHQRKRSR